MKTCKKCEVEKPLSDFYIKKSGVIQPNCKSCDKKIRQERHLANPLIRKAKNRKYAENKKAQKYIDELSKDKKNWPEIEAAIGRMLDRWKVEDEIAAKQLLQYKITMYKKGRIKFLKLMLKEMY